jgi:hypothetical protein
MYRDGTLETIPGPILCYREGSGVIFREESFMSEATPGSFASRAYAAGSPTSGLSPATIRRREPRPQDVQIDIHERFGVPYTPSPGG